MTTTHYNGSRGPVLIATMPHPHLVNAHSKLVREGDPGRAAEIEAMAAQIATNDAEHAALSEARGDDPGEMAALEQAFIAVDEERVAAMGHNNPPETTPWEGVKTHMDDLLVEVRNWADGAEIESQAQADEVARLIDQVREAEKAADEARKVEVQPLDLERDAIQTRYNFYIAPLKNKVPGKLPLASAALKATLSPWLQKLEDEKRAAAAKAKAEADEKAKLAAEAAALAQGDFGAMEEAEDLIADASAAQADAKRAANDKAQARGDGRAVSLRSYFTPVLTDPQAALRHYASTRAPELKAFLTGLAQADVREGKRQIPGFDVHEERRVA